MVRENNLNLFKVVKLSNGWFNGFMTWVSLVYFLCASFFVLKCTLDERDFRAKYEHYFGNSSSREQPIVS